MLLQGGKVNQVLTRLQYHDSLLQTKLKFTHTIYTKNIAKNLPVPSRWMARQRRKKQGQKRNRKSGKKKKERGEGRMEVRNICFVFSTQKSRKSILKFTLKGQ